MLALLIAALVGVVVIVLVWHLLRAVAAIAIVAVLVFAGLVALDRLGLAHGHAPRQFSALRHSVTHDVRSLEREVTRG